MSAGETPLLELRGISKRFGRVVVAESLSLTVAAGDAVGVVGPNGAGKSTLFSVISGDLAPNAGEVIFEGRAVTRLGPAERCRAGIGRTYQVPRSFPHMTVFENVLVAAGRGAGLGRHDAREQAVEVLEQTGLRELANRPASRLGLLPRKRLELARAMATRPRLLMLDEVAAGLTDPEVGELIEIVRGVRAAGVSVIWVEHVVRALVGVVERLICLAGGHFIGDGPPERVLADPRVKEVFLGTGYGVGAAGG
ncbi:MAG TPA: ABC transporter ATP-binding protein [Candidatus Dormibacteraeota bacterium]|nr:ABC transporter ATP-binding protein [Candidatus Dormibacteraeota bacterium]